MVRLPAYSEGDTGEIIVKINVVKDGEKWKAVLGQLTKEYLSQPSNSLANTLSAFDILPNNKVVNFGFY